MDSVSSRLSLSFPCMIQSLHKIIVELRQQMEKLEVELALFQEKRLQYGDQEVTLLGQAVAWCGGIGLTAWCTVSGSNLHADGFHHTLHWPAHQAPGYAPSFTRGGRYPIGEGATISPSSNEKFCNFVFQFFTIIKISACFQ